jgi:hypothetical protein
VIATDGAFLRTFWRCELMVYAQWLSCLNVMSRFDVLWKGKGLDAARRIMSRRPQWQFEEPKPLRDVAGGLLPY